MEKIAVTSEGPTLDDALDPRFGRAAGFIIVDPRTLQFQYVDNGAKVLLTGYVGPKAFAALQAAGVKVSQNLDNMTVRQAVERFRTGLVAWVAEANRMGQGR